MWQPNGSSCHGATSTLLRGGCAAVFLARKTRPIWGAWATGPVERGLWATSPERPRRPRWGAWATGPVERGLWATSPERPRRPRWGAWAPGPVERGLWATSPNATPAGRARSRVSDHEPGPD